MIRQRGARGLTPEKLVEHVKTQSARIAPLYGLWAEDLESAAMIRIIEDDRWQDHPNANAYCITLIRSTAVDKCRRRAVEKKHIDIIGRSLDDRHDALSDSPESQSLSNSTLADQFEGVELSVFGNEVEPDSLPAAVDPASLVNPRLAKAACKLERVDWGKSTLRPFLLVDSRLVLAKKLVSLSDDELFHLGNQVTESFTRAQFIEANLPWDAADLCLELSDSGLSIEDAWRILTQLIDDATVYHRATKKERNELPVQKLTAVCIAECLRQRWSDLKDNTWTAKCVRAWKTVKRQFPEIVADLQPHQRGESNE